MAIPRAAAAYNRQLIMVRIICVTLFHPGSGMTLSARTGPLWPWIGFSQF